MMSAWPPACRDGDGPAGADRSLDHDLCQECCSFGPGRPCQGHEVMVHMPMQPVDGGQSGPNALTVGMAEAEIQRRMDWGLGRSRTMSASTTIWAADYARCRRHARRAARKRSGAACCSSIQRPLPAASAIPWRRRWALPILPGMSSLDDDMSEAAVTRRAGPCRGSRPQARATAVAIRPPASGDDRGAEALACQDADGARLCHRAA